MWPAFINSSYLNCKHRQSFDFQSGTKGAWKSSLVHKQQEKLSKLKSNKIHQVLDPSETWGQRADCCPQNWRQTGGYRELQLTGAENVTEPSPRVGKPNLIDEVLEAQGQQVWALTTPGASVLRGVWDMLLVVSPLGTLAGHIVKIGEKSLCASTRWRGKVTILK